MSRRTARRQRFYARKKWIRGRFSRPLETYDMLGGKPIFDIIEAGTIIPDRIVAGSVEWTPELSDLLAHGMSMLRELFDCAISALKPHRLE